MSKLFGQICQVGYIVRDIEAAMQRWVSIGVGPWFYRKESPVTEFNYYGKPSKLPRMAIALANSGGVQIELIQPLNDAPSLYLDMLDAGAEGVQHVAYWTETEFDKYCDDLKERGFKEGHSGRMGRSGRFAYFVHDDVPGTVVEISETTGGKGERFKAIREAAETWDGADPIREVVLKA